MRQNREFCKDKSKYNTFLTDYEGDLNDDINDVNKKANHSKNNDENSTQYIIAAHLSNKSFIYLLIAQDTFLLNKGSIAQHFVLNQYIKTVF